MKLIHCKKCGHPMITEDAIVERMNDTIHELNEKARKSKNGKIAKSYLAEAASVTKMMKGILHNTANIEARTARSGMYLRILVEYLLANNLITEDKLKELNEQADKMIEEKNAADQKELERIYGNYKKLYTPSNNTMSDPTADKAINK